MGNLTVYPGSHYQLQNYFRIYGFEDLYLKGVQGLPQLDFTATKPIQIRARAGDAIILNYCTAHNIAPNISPFIRYTVYFRLTKQVSRPLPRAIQSNSTLSPLPSPNTLKHRPDAMLNVWSDWSGLQRMPFYFQDNPFHVVVALDRNAPLPALPPASRFNPMQQQQQQQRQYKTESPTQSQQPPSPQYQYQSPPQQQYQQQPPSPQYLQQQQRPQYQYQSPSPQQNQQLPPSQQQPDYKYQYQYQQPQLPQQIPQPQKSSNRNTDESDEEMRQLAMILERSKYDK